MIMLRSLRQTGPKFGNSFELVDNHVEILDEIIPIDQMGDDYTVIIEIDDPTDEPDVPENLILDVPEVEPSFPGGDEALYSFIVSHAIVCRSPRARRASTGFVRTAKSQVRGYRARQRSVRGFGRSAASRGCRSPGR